VWRRQIVNHGPRPPHRSGRAGPAVRDTPQPRSPCKRINDDINNGSNINNNDNINNNNNNDDDDDDDDDDDVDNDDTQSFKNLSID